MFDINAFLDRAKRAAKVTSDYALAVKVLGYAKQTTVSNWRSGRTMPDEGAIVKLCALSGDDPEHVAACIQSMRAANDDAAGLWRRVAERLKSNGGYVDLVLLIAIAFVTIAGPVLSAEVAGTSAGLYIMSNAVYGIAAVRLAWRLTRLAHSPQRRASFR